MSDLSGRWEAVAKRIMDLGVSIPASIVSAPVVVVLAIGSTIAYRANPFFVQTRVGKCGRLFRCIKIRTLPTNAPCNADKPTIADHVFDRWGGFLRRNHLDELPQFWLVARGTMSLVGPRPVIPEHSESFDAGFVERRLTLRPGVTGLWQIGPCANEPIGDHPDYDDYYVEHRTLRLDIWILLKTAQEVLSGGRLPARQRIPRWTGAAYPPDGARG